MRNFINKLSSLFRIVKKGELIDLYKFISDRIYSNSTSFVLRRDLEMPYIYPSAKIKLKIREYKTNDYNDIVNERPRRLSVLKAGIPVCFVAVSENEEICYMQWLIGKKDIEKLKPFFLGNIPDLKEDEMLLEFAYTFEKFRGKGIMPEAMSKIAERGEDFGARYIITFVKTDNIPSLKGCKKAGFSPYKIRYEKWRLFNYSERITPIEEKINYQFEV